jgi:hypothetical protein
MDSSKDKLRIKFEQLKGIHSIYHRQIDKNRRYYEMEFGIDVVPEAAQDRGFVPVIPPTARQAIDEAADHILTTPKVKIPVRPTESETTTAQDIAEKKRKFMTVWWRQIGHRSNPIGDGRKILLNEGKICLKKTLRWDLIPDKDDKEYEKILKGLGKYEFLWDLELLDNKTVYEDPVNHRDPQYVFVHYEIFVEEAKRLFPEATGTWTDRDDYDKVEYLEYWSAPKFAADGEWENGKYIQWIEQDRVHDDDNPYPYIPIAIEDSGYGTIQKLSKVEQKYKGFSEFSHSIFVAQARQWSAMEAVAELTAFSPIITRNLDEAKAAVLQLGPGEIWSLDGSPDDPEREDIEFPQLPPIPITVPQMIQLTDRAANSTLKMDILGGLPQTGVDTATEADQNVRNATAKLASPVSALERLAAKISRWVLMDIHLVLEAPVTLYGVTSDDPGEINLTTRDIAGFYDCWIELRTTDEDAVAQSKARFWLEMALRAPFLSFFTAMERGGIADDPLAEMLKRSAEEVFLSEEFKVIRTMTGAQSFGELASLIREKGIENQGVPGGGINQNVGTGAAVGTGEYQTPTQDTLQNQALTNRDVNFGSAQLWSANRSPE